MRVAGAAATVFLWIELPNPSSPDFANSKRYCRKSADFLSFQRLTEERTKNNFHPNFSPFRERSG
jgi:hypothetical protein